VKRILKRKKIFKSLFWDIEKISRKLRFENVTNNENLVSKDWIKNISSKKMTFNASFLKLYIVLFILQQFDSFAQRVRFLVKKASMKYDKKNENAKRFNSKKKMTTSCRIVIARMSISIRRSNEISRTIYCAERTNDTFFQSFSKENFWNKIMTIRTLIISSMRKLSICWKENIFETTWTKTSRNTLTFVRHVIESSSWNTNRTICCNRFSSSKDRDKIERWISSQTCHSRNKKKSCMTRC
jgi:carbon starvation protein CstA